MHNPSPTTTADTLLRRFHRNRRRKETRNTTLSVLLLAAVVGCIAGFIGVMFSRLVNWVTTLRTESVIELSLWASVPLMFLLSGGLAMLGYLLVQRLAPEAGGSGIPEIEGALQDIRPVRWWRVIPAKFIGGVGTLGAGMVLGREGPTVQMGANAGQMVHDIFRLNNKNSRHTLLATGAGAGLAAAFNAPLAGILLIIEEMRPEFRYNLVSIHAVTIGAIMSTMVYRFFDGQLPMLEIAQSLLAAPLETYWLYLVLGICFGVVGIMFNTLILKAQLAFQRFNSKSKLRFIITGGVIGGSLGAIGLLYPSISNDGFHLIERISVGHFSLALLASIFFLRLLTTVASFSSGAPGGIFAPVLALGTLFGTAFGMAAILIFPDYELQAGTFAVAGMGALFAATVRAPLTGTILVLEVTASYQLIMPMIITCLGATLVAQLLGGKPLYSQLLEHILERQKQAELDDAPR
nr:H(+)/Cl(-) exchange transporter ClcA [Halomonas halocynthiae]